MTRYRIFLIGAALIGALSCDHSPVVVSLPPPPPPQPGRLTMRLTTPNTDDGAIVVEVHGRGVTQVQLSDTTMFLLADSVDITTQRFVIVGDLKSGAVVTFRVPDVLVAGSYAATIVEVADRANGVRTSLEGYEVTVRPD